LDPGILQPDREVINDEASKIPDPIPVTLTRFITNLVPPHPPITETSLVGPGDEP
jgi:hypothetical protein